MSTAMTRQEIEEKIIARARQDTSFKQELLSNPLLVDLPFLVELTQEEEQSIQGGAGIYEAEYNLYRHWGRQLDKGVTIVRGFTTVATTVAKKLIGG